MRIFRDYENRAIRLTSERMAHIQRHLEMREHFADIARVLDMPERVVQSGGDPEARLYYRYMFDTVVGDKYLCVVVKARRGDVFILTAYFTDAVKRGQLLWPINPK